ncbi:MAG: protein-export chaperone SecB, partial [Legionellales bacterium]|nr:protein-export chaperone SecB [Legionellales bacterium]
QAGIFTISGFPEQDLERALACFCATNIYPYASVVVTDLITRGGFPQIVLPPINFDAIYESRKKEQSQNPGEKTH